MHRKILWGGLISLVAGVVAVYVLVVRPWHMQWGATPQEVALVLPGDSNIIEVVNAIAADGGLLADSDSRFMVQP